MSFSAAITAILHLVCAQQPVTFKGELFTVNGAPSGTYAVEITSVTNHTSVDRTISSSTGKFEFRSVEAGNYTITVTTENGDIVGMQDVSSMAGYGPIRIQITEAPLSKAISGTVPVETLRHRPPKKAVQELNLAIKAYHDGDSEKAHEHLLSAIHLDPDFSEAHTNLGAEYARAGKYDLAYGEFQTALKIGPKEAMEYCNIAVIALALNHVEEAERTARQALQLDSRSSRANFVLGKILAGEPGHEEEAVRHLKLAAVDFPTASDMLKRLVSSR